MVWYFDVITKNYFNFNGRARRTEFWMFMVVHLIVIFLLLFLGLLPLVIYILLTIIPSVAVGIRRLHDTGKSAWWILAANVPILFVIYYYYMALEGDSGPNIYGDSPKESYMDRVINNIDSNNYNKTASLGQSTFDISNFDLMKIFGNEAYIQIIIVVIIALSIILS